MPPPSADAHFDEARPPAIPRCRAVAGARTADCVRPARFLGPRRHPRHVSCHAIEQKHSMSRFVVALGTLVVFAGCAAGAAEESSTLPDAVAVLCEDGWPRWDVDGTDTPPEATNHEEVVAQLRRRFGRPARRLVAEAVMRVTSLGDVDAACIRSSSGSPRFDRMVLEAAYTLQFRPGLKDGEPASVSASIPFALSRTRQDRIPLRPCSTCTGRDGQGASAQPREQPL